jgi:hypothetical protein
MTQLGQAQKDQLKVLMEEFKRLQKQLQAMQSQNRLRRPRTWSARASDR